MRIRKVFESDNHQDQFDEIKSIFTEFMDEKMDDDYGEDGSQVSRCSCYMGDKYISVTIYKFEKDDFSDNISGFNEIVNSYLDESNLLKRIKVALSRLDNHNYQWGINIHDTEIVIKIIYDQDSTIELIDAFNKNGIRFVLDVTVLSKILKKYYNISYRSYHTSKTMNGKTILYIYVHSNEPDIQKLTNDLRLLKKPGKCSNVFNSVLYTSDGLLTLQINM